jgi:ATPase subunit of ABC transporter with duplicated ATPase domains
MLSTNQKVFDIYQQASALESVSEEDWTSELEEKYNQLTATDEYLEYEEYERNTKIILKGLGITDSQKEISSFSGGWKMRLAIAKALVCKPDVLFMDEPTNHLDLNAVIWLSNFLSEYDNTLVITSHQIEFINQFSDYVWYIGSPDFRTPRIYTVKGDYHTMMQSLADITKDATSKYNKMMNRVEQMKKKSTPKKEVEEFIAKENCARPPLPYDVKITFPEVGNIGDRTVVKFNEVSFGYQPDNLILENIDWGVSMNSRHLIVGNNGTGKSTLFKLLMGTIEPTSGSIVKDSRVRIGYYNQHLVESLPLDKTPIEYLKSFDESLDIQKCRAILGKLGLKKIEGFDPCNTQIEKLSGGQKARISFGGLQVLSPSIILLDEPTNHLDIESIEGLIQGVNDYSGGIVMITHDVHFIKSIENVYIYQLADKQLNMYGTDIDEYIEDVLH